VSPPPAGYLYPFAKWSLHRVISISLSIKFSAFICFLSLEVLKNNTMAGFDIKDELGNVGG